MVIYQNCRIWGNIPKWLCSVCSLTYWLFALYQDNPKTCHSVETLLLLLVHKPHQKTQSLEVVTVKKEDADRGAEIKKDASETIPTDTSDNIASEKPKQKEESPEKEALDLTVK